MTLTAKSGALTAKGGTVTVAGDVAIPDLFADGFEGAAVGTNWNATSGSGLSLETTTPIEGAKSMRYTHDGTRANGSVEKQITAQTGTVYAQFKMRLDTLVPDTAYNLHRIFSFNGVYANLEFGHAGTPADGYVLYGNGAFATVSGTIFSEGGLYLITVYFKPATSGANGQAALWVNGTQIGSAATHSDTGSVTGIKLGNTAVSSGGLGAGTSLVFDSVRVNTTPLPLTLTGG